MRLKKNVLVIGLFINSYRGDTEYRKEQKLLPCFICMQVVGDCKS